MDIALFLVAVALCAQISHSAKRGHTELSALISDFDGNIYIYNVNNSSIRRIAISDTGQGPEALDFDPVTSQVYWTNIRSDKIKRSNLDGSDEHIVLSEAETPRGIAIDHVRRLMFYTEEKVDVIGRVNLTSNNHTIILRSNMDRPLAITLDIHKEIIYWSDIGTPSKIEYMSYDSTNRKVLLSTGLKWPIALTLDDTRRKLFWCDGSRKKIQYIDLVTKEITLVLYKYGTHYYDLNFVDGTLYFIDLNTRHAFQSISASGGEVKTYLFGLTMSKWRKIRVIKTLVCDDMSWGVNCTKNCGKCLGDKICNQWDGQCPRGCKLGFEPPTCIDVCRSGYYGDGCNFTCGQCHGDGTCDTVTGLCPHGCAAGWDGTYCTAGCLDGAHGRKCESMCGHCLGGNTCDKTTGNCPSNCEAGWHGQQCKNGCSNGTFGVNCQYMCQCGDRSTCDKLSGQCPIASTTQRGCPVSRYGSNCSQVCGQCVEGLPCDVETGRCVTGCDKGWKGDMCTTECPVRRFGYNCSEVCQCADAQVCDSTSGRCYPGPRTEQQVSEGNYNDTPVTAALCAVIVILTVFLVVLIVIVYKKKRQETASKARAESMVMEQDVVSLASRSGHQPLITT